MFMAIFIAFLRDSFSKWNKNGQYKNCVYATVLAYFIAMNTDLVPPSKPLYLFL